jgi:hypothetical protein
MEVTTMGYTHYWRSPAGTNLKDNWESFTKDVKTLLAHEKSSRLDPVKGNLVGPLGEPKSKPQVNKNFVAFNGVIFGFINEGHETFKFDRVPKYPEWRKDEPLTFTFCKTALKPYDLYVCAVLLIAKFHFKDKVIISTDGDLENWQPAYVLLQKLGINNIHPLEAVKW